ncbi:MAG: hypothetical protein IIB77_04165, partial [Proteobacteria bacterium]|nr:hypothetical protein [Pseudomonadota bacterium]
MMSTGRIWMLATSVAFCHLTLLAQTPVASVQPPLPIPTLLEKEARESGNPLATYLSLLKFAERYRNSAAFAGIYEEGRLNYEEFLGVPFAGGEAMSLPAYKAKRSGRPMPIGPSYEPVGAVEVIIREARKTRIVIWAEEHHLPETRSLYETLLSKLADEGYKYLAAEAFADEVMGSDFTHPGYRSGYYLMDPVFSSAVRTAKSLGFKLVAYDTSERGPPGDHSFRDRTQAEQIQARLFADDPTAKVFVVAGRGHAAELKQSDGWTPMASVLKELTGIDPFTIYSPTMSQRLTPEEEHPFYRYATSRGLVEKPTIFVDRDAGRILGSASCDAYVFWPRISVTHGRPDWLVAKTGRKRVPIPDALLSVGGLRLVQAFAGGDPQTAIPADQILVRRGGSHLCLCCQRVGSGYASWTNTVALTDLPRWKSTEHQMHRSNQSHSHRGRCVSLFSRAIHGDIVHFYGRVLASRLREGRDKEVTCAGRGRCSSRTVIVEARTDTGLHMIEARR